MVRTPGFHPGNRGSIPRRVTNESMCQSEGLAHVFVYDFEVESNAGANEVSEAGSRALQIV